MENPQTEGDIIGLIQVWELAYRQCPFRLIDTKGNEKNIFQKKNYFSLDLRQAVHFQDCESENSSNKCGYSRKKCFFSKFCIVDAALQNGDTLGSNNRTETVDTAMKSVDDKFLKN